jgi:hypothetical protein
VNSTENANKKDLSKAIQRISDQLVVIQKDAPKLYLALKDKVTIWITDDQWQKSAMVYCQSMKWLRENGHDYRLAHGIEIISVDHFLAWSVPGDQPMMLLHELVHAYHDQIMGSDNSDVIDAYDSAVKSGKYAKVRYHTMKGPQYPAYALNNSTEYFAEISEAYFGTNDYFPFNREQLKEYDLQGYNLVEKYLVHL